MPFFRNENKFRLETKQEIEDIRKARAEAQLEAEISKDPNLGEKVKDLEKRTDCKSFEIAMAIAMKG